MPPRRSAAPVVIPGRRWLAAILLVLGVLSAACKQASHTSDSQLRPIEKMLDQQLPPGTTSARVGYFLSSRGYSQEPAPKSGTIVALIHHVDTQTLQPVTARVTFHFDANNHLTSYELDRGPETPPQP